MAADQKFSRMTLTAMVVASMVGADIFSLPARFGDATGASGAIVAWIIAGAGMVMLAFVFQSLAVRRPDLDAGIYAYPQAGFGDFLGFAAAFGFKYDLLSASFWGGGEYSASNVFDQVRGTMLVTVFVFIGIEGASVYSRYAKKREDLGWATVVGFIGVLGLRSL